MRFRPFLSLALILGLTPFSIAADNAATTGPDLPEAETGKLYQDAKSQPADKAQRLAKNAELLAAARKCLADHPEVPVTATYREILVRRIMLPAAERMFRDDPSAANREQLRTLASEVVKNPVTDAHLIVREKVAAATTLARLDIYSGDDKTPVDAAKHIRALMAAFPKDAPGKNAAEFAGQAIVNATGLAVQTKETALADELCKEIAASYLATSGALDVLAAAGHPPVFEGEMTTLDGKTLRFPEDAKGKVVVLDFWATWCGPCVASLPHIREIHEQYKDRGVWCVGVSCDNPMPKETPEQNKQKVADFVKARNCPWTQTYTGEWPAAAVKYGVGSIPTVFVIGRDGRILSASARGREAQLIEQALAAPQAP
ncbi:MAG: TlpA family protein disulfide reductase [Verrucomicrobia bacterium]|nr:TlpA family protein disulfide reductase [Verrucomicrobiota bacterium]